METFCTGVGNGTIVVVGAAACCRQGSQVGCSVETTNRIATATVTVCEKRSQALRIAEWCSSDHYRRRQDNGAWLPRRARRSP
jgi:hypothetical protein